VQPPVVKVCVLWIVLWCGPLSALLRLHLPPLQPSLLGQPVLRSEGLYCATIPLSLLLAHAAWLAITGLAPQAGKSKKQPSPHTLLLGLGLLGALIFGSVTVKHQQQWQDEGIVLQSAVEINPNNPDARFALGLYYAAAKGGDLEGARRHFLKAHELAPQHAQPLIQIGELLFAQGNSSAAMKEFMKAVKVAPGSSAPYRAIGRVFLEQNSYKKAEQSLKTALKLNPLDAVALNILGEVHMSRNELQEAQDLYKSAAGLHPTFYEAQNNLGTVLMRLGKAEEAVAAFDTVLKLPKQHASAFLAHYNIATALQMLGRLDDAIRHYKIAIALNSQYPDFFFNMAIALQKKAQNVEDVLQRKDILNEVIGAYRSFLQEQPDDAQAHYNLGYALDDVGMKEEAKTSFLKARKLNPDLPPYQP